MGPIISRVAQTIAPQFSQQQSVKNAAKLLQQTTQLITQKPVHVVHGDTFAFSPQNNTLYLDLKMVEKHSVDQLAFIALHEGGHAVLSLTHDLPKEHKDWVHKNEQHKLAFNITEDPRMDYYATERYPASLKLKRQIPIPELDKDALPHIQFSHAVLGHFHNNSSYTHLAPDIRTKVDEALPIVKRIQQQIPRGKIQGDTSLAKQKLQPAFDFGSLPHEIEFLLRNGFTSDMLHIDPRLEKNLFDQLERYKTTHKSSPFFTHISDQTLHHDDVVLLLERVVTLTKEKFWPIFESVLDQSAQKESNGQHQTYEESPDDVKEAIDNQSKGLSQAIQPKTPPSSLPESAKPSKVTLQLSKNPQDYKVNLPSDTSNKTDTTSAEGTTNTDNKEDTIDATDKTDGGDPANSTDKASEGDPSDKAEGKDAEDATNASKPVDMKTIQAESQVRQHQLDLLSGQSSQRLSPYHIHLSEQRVLINQLKAQFKTIFKPDERGKFQTGYTSGTKIHLRSAIQAEMRPDIGGPSRIFQRRTEMLKATPIFSLVMDLSASMEGENILEATKALVIFSEVLTSLDFKFEVRGFHSRQKVFKAYEKPLSKSDIIPEMEDFLGGATDDLEAVSQAIDTSKTQKGSKKIIIVFSDGDGSIRDREFVWERKKEEAKKANIQVIGVGIGSDINELDEVYEKSVMVEEVKKLPSAMATLLKQTLRREHK